MNRCSGHSKHTYSIARRLTAMRALVRSTNRLEEINAEIDALKLKIIGLTNDGSVPPRALIELRVLKLELVDLQTEYRNEVAGLPM